MPPIFRIYRAISWIGGGGWSIFWPAGIRTIGTFITKNWFRCRPIWRKTTAACGSISIELKALGVEPANGPEGMVDFPSVLDGRKVALCWKLGEPEVIYWHDPEAGCAKVVWQVKVIHQWSDGTKITNSKIFPLDKWNALVRTWNNQAACGLKVRLKPGQASADPCITSYKSSYRGQENQLYRVEIHDGGKIDGKSVPTFKWSRDNGSIVFPIISQEGSLVILQSLGFDSRTTLKVGNWVEITDDTHEMQGKPGILAQVEEIVDSG